MFWQSKTKVAEAFHTFGEEEIAELLLKIKTRQEKQVILSLHCHVMKNKNANHSIQKD